MAAVLKPRANAFALLESNDPGDTRLVDLGAPTKVDAAASLPVNINRKQQPQMSVWKADKVKAEANAGAKNKQRQPTAPKTNAGVDAGRNRRPPQPAASRTIQVSGAAANAAKNMKRPQPPAGAKAQVNAAASAAVAKPFQFQFQQQPPAPANLTQILFGDAYPSARALIYKNRKPNALGNAKDGVAGGAPTYDSKGGHPIPNAPSPATVQEEPPAPVNVKAVMPPSPPPTLNDSAQFPSLK